MNCAADTYCTTDTCVPGVGCLHVVDPGRCLIDGGCYEDNFQAGQCRRCHVADSATTWVYAAGGSCDDGDPCTEKDTCGLAGTSEAGCHGVPYSCDDGVSCTLDLCNGLGGCSHKTLPGACWIDGQCWSDGQVNPANACQTCWSPADYPPMWHIEWWTWGDGVACGLGQTCFQGACCTPDCAGKSCGTDGCGSSCGSCSPGTFCTAGACLPGDCPGGYVMVPAGTFLMGSPYDEPGNASIHHREAQAAVTLTRAFCVKATEVTQDEWLSVIGTNPSSFVGCGGDCPVEGVSWWDALAYCNALSLKEGLLPCYTLTGCTGTVACATGSPNGCPGNLTCTGVTLSGLSCTGYRLPTYAEWEYAARAGTSTGTYNGTTDWSHLGCQEPDAVLDPIAWFCGNSGTTYPGAASCVASGPQGKCGTHPVQGRQANPWGLYDMLGNVFEWCWDSLTVPDSAEPMTDPIGSVAPATGSPARGGAWDSTGVMVRAATVLGSGEAGRFNNDIGLRPVRTLCVPSCDARNCGDDGCGGTCGTCDDGLPCTLDECRADGTCGHTALADGVACGTGTCADLVWTSSGTCVAGACTAAGRQVDCDDGLACTTDSCDADGCRHMAVPGFCAADGACHRNGEANPANRCESCRPALSGLGWSNVVDGSYCLPSTCDGLVYTARGTCLAGQCAAGGGVADCDDHVDCTTDTCSPENGCGHSFPYWECLVDGRCWAQGQANPSAACQACNADASVFAWSPVGEGATCGPGQNCFQGECCTPVCDGKVCGDDRCGGSCGACDAGSHCAGATCDAGDCPAGYVGVPAGTFSMGTPNPNPWGASDEYLHQVTISKGYCLKATEVTQDEWMAVIGTRPSYFGSCGGTCPVENVSWWDAVAFCNALSVREGLRPCYVLAGCQGNAGDGCPAAMSAGCVGGFACADLSFAGVSCSGYRLPTEAEWEYAARAGSSTATYAGTGADSVCTEPNPVLDPIAWFCGNTGATNAVGGKQPNVWGLYDLLGNVGEWVWDNYGGYAWGGPNPVDPTGPMSYPMDYYRMVRGGDWTRGARSIRAAWRDESRPRNRDFTLGFRPARSIP